MSAQNNFVETMAMANAMATQNNLANAMTNATATQNNLANIMNTTETADTTATQNDEQE